VFLAAGISASIIPLPVDAQALEFDFWWMTGVALLVGMMMMHKGQIHRWKGALLLLIYLAYIGWIGGAVAAVAAI
jgi:cation:H+ antiporter